MLYRLCCGLCLVVSGLGCVLPASANDAGGGTNGVGPNVTLRTNSTSITLSNGTLTAVITKSSAQVTSMKFMGREMVLAGGNMYFSMDGSPNYENPANGVFWIKTNTTDMVDAGFRCTMTSHHAFNVDIHYVLRRGDTGLYVYAILSHPTNYADTAYGEWRMVWKMEQDPLERIYVDDLRNWQQPSAYDLAHALPTGIAEIVQLTTGPWAGRYDCKYMYNVEYEKIGCYGHASNTNKVGAWMVFGGYDFFNDGPTKQDLAPASGINHVHFGRNHYNGSSLSVATNEFWSKCYGPFLLYCNTNGLGGDACWADAQAQVDAEKSAWPYAWLTGETNYPVANQRGAVSGTLVFTDALKPAVNAAGAWVGLADPSVADWQFESKFYQYWVRADAGGNFTIPNVRPGTYTLHAFNVGAVGEFSQTNITVTALATNNIGTLTWNVPHAGGYLAWEIGVPDRLATEFRHGTNYWEPYIWDTFADEFSNPLEYNLDSANPAWDWNYAHNFYGTNVAVWDWNLRFTLPAEPPSSNARLTIATAGGESSHLYVYVNGSLRGNFYPPNAGGNSLLRQGVHDKYGVAYVTFNASTFLNAGSNVITLQQVNSTPATGNCTMYDYVALEMPGSAPAVQFYTWQGGLASNRWDSGVTSNWYAYGRSQQFLNGLKVLFNDTGDSAPVRLEGTLLPASVVVNANRDYTFTGPGALTAAMPLTKKGPGTLTLTGTNSYIGDTRIEGGRVRVAGSNGASGGLSDTSRVLLAAGAELDLNGCAEQTGPLADLHGAGGLVTNSAAAPAALTLYSASGSNHFTGRLTDRPGAPLTLNKTGGGTQTLAGPSSWHGDTTITSGTLALFDPASLATTPNLTVSSGANLDVRGLPASLLLGSGQTLKGSGVILGNCTVGPGATLAPGTSIGTLTFSNALSLAGTSSLEISKSPKTNDAVNVSGLLTFGGRLVVTHASGALAGGDNFKLFSAASYSNSFAGFTLPSLPTGLAWNTSQLAVEGRLWVVSTQPPLLTAPLVTGTNFVLTATNGTPGWPCWVLSSTNVALPRSQWARIVTNLFNAGGAFSFTNGVGSGIAQRFYRLQVP